MFIQVFQGPVADANDARVMVEDWLAHLAPGAQGWLGSTTGVSDDGMLVAMARFESREAARRNSERPEQGEWWERCSKLFTGDVTFRDCSKVTTSRRGGSDDAGFVQVIQGHSPDPARLDELAREFDERAGGLRPELYGFLLAWDERGGGGFPGGVGRGRGGWFRGGALLHPGGAPPPRRAAGATGGPPADAGGGGVPP